MEDLKAAKKEIRKALRAKGRALPPEYCRAADHAIASRLFEMPAFIEAQNVFCYVGVDWEIDTREILEEILKRGKTLCTPLCTKEPGVMQARVVSGFDCLRPGKYDIPEPDPDLCPELDPARLDLVLTPCLSCTREGLRLGQGGGYYDRFMGRAGGSSVLLCRTRMLSDTLPAEPWDVVFRNVLTEEGLLINENPGARR